MERLNIGRMASLNCVSTRALRMYDEMGLLVPAERDESTGYRYYSLAQCATLDAIQQLQHLGFSLEEIKELLDAHDERALYQRLEDRERVIDDQMDDLQRSKCLLQKLKMGCFFTTSDVADDDYRIEVLPERRALRFDLAEYGLADNEQSGSDVLDTWQMAVCAIKRSMIEKGIPEVYFRNVACCIPKERLGERPLCYSQALVFVMPDDRAVAPYSEPVPAGRYLTTYCRDLGGEDGPLRETMRLLQMLDHIGQHGYTPAGDYIGEVVVDTDLFSFTGRDELVKMQIRID